VKDFDDNTEYIKDKCMKRNARCYIKVNKRNNEIVSANLVRYIVDVSEFNKTFKDVNVLEDAESLLFY
jgi:hypothetical protein